MSRRMGIREFARSAEVVALFGRVLAASTITRYHQAGKIVMDAGKIDVEASLARLTELGVGKIRPDMAEFHARKTREKGRHGKKSTSGISNYQSGKKNAPELPKQPVQDPAPVGGINEPGEPGEHGGGRLRYKTALIAYENQTLKLALALATGKRIPRTAALDAAGALGNSLRAAIERLIDQTAPRLAVTHDPARRAAILADQTARIRRAIEREFVNHLRRLRRLRSAPRSEAA
jgi:hypothetical protein